MGRLPLVLLLSASLSASGCTLVGTAIGAGIPRYERATSTDARIELGTRVRVRLRNIGADSAGSAAIAGRYGGIRDGLLSVTDDDGREHEIATSDVLDLELYEGTEWKKGLILGAAADTIIVVAAVAIANGANVSIATGR